MKIKHSATLILASAVVLVLIIASWQMQQNINQQFRQDIGNSLRSVLNTTQQAVSLWQEDQVRAAMVWATAPEIVRLAEDLLATSKNHQALNNAPAQAELRKWLRTAMEGENYLGFFIIAPDNLSLASSRTSNVGTENLLTAQPLFLQRLWSGNGALSLPMHSDVPINGMSADYSHSMFVGAPIRNADDEIIALLTFRIDPEHDFSAILQRGRIGETGETYAFDKKGLLLSESRFDQKLQEIGLIDSISHGTLGVYIKDPGVQLSADNVVEHDHQRLPLTLMAKNAISGQSGINLDGYRDYRGVFVVGVWLWDQQLDMGFTTELNVTEAYDNYYKIRRTIITLTSVAIILTILLTLALVWLKRKNSLDYQQRLMLLDKQKNLELDEAEFRQKSILESAAEGVVIIDEHGKIQSINRAAEQLFGYSQADVLDKNVSLFVPEPHKSNHDSYLANYRETGKRKVLGKTIEVKGQKKDGSLFLFDLSLSESWLRGKRIFVGFVHDLSALKLAQENLQLLSRAVEQSPASVVITDPIGNIEYVNPRFVEVTGYNMTEVLGKNPRMLKSGFTSKKEYQQLWQTIIAGNEWQGELQNVKKNGELFWESVCISPIKNSSGKIGHFLATKENISERKKSQFELQQAKHVAELANKAKSEFLANMSHEIRTPLNGIIGMTSLLSTTSLIEKQLNYLSKIRSSSEVLLGIINDILDFSKIEAGKLSMENVEFELDRVLSDISNIVGFQAEEKAIELLFDVDPSLPYYLLGDSLRLNQVLLNLLSNAVKFTEAGEIVVKIRHQPSKDNKVRLIFSVKDTGIGLSNEQVKRLFNPFTQVDGSTTRKYGGTGLGLSICKQLVGLMNGDISVSSELGKGSCFQFSAEFGLGNNEAKYLYVLPKNLRGLRVLVVDDCHTVLDVMCYQLNSFGFHVEIANTGKQALQTLLAADKDKPIQLVIMDWKMPNMDGLATAEQIKQNKQLSFIPVIIMHSIYKWDEFKFEAEKTGIDGYINKPVNRSALFDVIMETFHFQLKADKHKQASSFKRLPNWSNLNGYQVLLVEDNEINQEVAQEILKSEGLNVYTANNGFEALELLGRMEVDLVLMDIQMPKMDGFQATREIRAQTKYAQLPVIAMTANAMDGDRERCLAAGMNDHVTKPIVPEKLFSIISHWLEVVVKEKESAVHMRNARSYAFELNMFDVDSALSRLNNDTPFYLQLLGKFRANFTDFVAELTEQISHAKYDNAQALAHRLSGVASNLSATTLYGLSSELDRMLSSDFIEENPDLPGKLNELKQEMKLVFAEIDGLEIDNLFDVKNEPPTEQSLPSQLSDFNDLLENYDASAVKYIETLRLPLSKLGREADFKKIRACLHNYDFDKALNISRKIKT